MSTKTDNEEDRSLHPIVRRGWRGFLCDCGKTWKLPTRDHTSPSVETCPVEDCGLDTQPIAAWPDETLAVDKWGNLVNAPAAGEYSPNTDSQTPR